MTDTELDALAARLAPRLANLLLQHLAPKATPEPIPHKLTPKQFAWCIQRTPYWVNEETRINPKLRAFVQGKRPKLIHPAALALYGVDPQHAATRLALCPALAEGCRRC